MEKDINDALNEILGEKSINGEKVLEDTTSVQVEKIFHFFSWNLGRKFIEIENMNCTDI